MEYGYRKPKPSISWRGTCVCIGVSVKFKILSLGFWQRTLKLTVKVKWKLSEFLPSLIRAWKKTINCFLTMWLGNMNWVLLSVPLPPILPYEETCKSWQKRKGTRWESHRSHTWAGSELCTSTFKVREFGQALAFPSLFSRLKILLNLPISKTSSKSPTWPKKY